MNPLCGDRVEVELRSAEGSSLEIAARGRGCSILVAAASVMTELVAGREPAEARQLHAWLRRLLADEEPDAEVDERLAAFRGIGRLPFRERCAELPWEALEEALGRLP